MLGVTKTATQDEIRKAFRKLARTHHPDVAKDKKTAESKFKEINEANEVLSDPEKRKRYDELGADWNSPGRQGPPRGSHPGGGMDLAAAVASAISSRRSSVAVVLAERGSASRVSARLRSAAVMRNWSCP